MNYRVTIGKATFYITNQHPNPETTEELKVPPKLSDDLKELLGLGNPSDTITWSKFVSMYNEAASRNPCWTKLLDRNKDVNRRFLIARRSYPSVSEWEMIIAGMEQDPFYSGKSGVYDRPKALTLFRDSRYNEFYEAALHNQDKPKEPSVDDFLSSLKGVG